MTQNWFAELDHVHRFIPTRPRLSGTFSRSGLP